MRSKVGETKVPAMAVLAGLLLLLGGTLLIAPSVFEPRRDLNGVSGPPVMARPSPTWRAFPTRMPAGPPVDPTVAPPVDLLVLHQALLRGDLDEAAAMWQTLVVADAGPSAAAFQAGARLALLQGRPGIAAERAWQAIGVAPADALSWSLLGIILRYDDRAGEAEQALAIAKELDPKLGPQLFSDQWRLARTNGATLTLAELAEDYQLRQPDSVWLPYYQAEALIAAGAPLDAIELLVPVLTETPTSPALLWFTLGRAYLARGGYREAATALEAAAARTYQGDRSLEIVSDDPLLDLNMALARSYLGSDRCREAEMIFSRLLVTDPDLGPMIEAAIICQTPTPTLTPWIPKQIGTVTPRP